MLTPPAASTYLSDAFRAIFHQGLKRQPLTRVRFLAVGASCHTLKGSLPLSRGPCCRRFPQTPAPSVWGTGSGLEQGQGDELGSPHSSWVHSHKTRSSPKNVGPAALWRSPGVLGWGPRSRTEGAQKPWRRARILHGPLCTTFHSQKDTEPTRHIPHCLGGNLLRTGKTREEPESHHGRGLAEHGREASSRDPEAGAVLLQGTASSRW